MTRVMAAFQIIEEKGKPKFVVLPFGDREAVEDYLDELWAQKAVKAFKSRKGEKCFTLEEAETLLSLNRPQPQQMALPRKPKRVMATA